MLIHFKLKHTIGEECSIIVVITNNFLLFKKCERFYYTTRYFRTFINWYIFSLKTNALNLNFDDKHNNKIMVSNTYKNDRNVIKRTLTTEK